MKSLDILTHIKKPGLLAAMTIALAGAPFLQGDASAQTILKAAFGAQTAHPSYQGLEKVKQLVEERTKGEVKIELYPDRQLGEEREAVEGLQFGSVDLTVVSTGSLLAFVPELAAIDLPFIFRDSEHAYAVLDGDIGRGLLDQFAERQIMGLAWWENGWRHITANKAIASPEDMSNLKIRTMQNPIHISYFQAIGAAPAPMAWGEVFTSLGQGIIDAQENPISIIYFSSLWEVQSHLILSRHLYSPHAVLFSKQTWDRLSQEHRDIISDAVREATDFARSEAERMDKELVVKLEEQGMTVLDIDTTPFQDIAVTFAEKRDDIPAEMVEKIAKTGK